MGAYMRSRPLLLATLGFLLALSVKDLRSQEGGTMSFSAKSSAFTEGAAIPKKYILLVFGFLSASKTNRRATTSGMYLTNPF